VLADEPERRALRYLQRDAAQRPELLVASATTSHRRGLQALVAVVVEAEPLRDVLDLDGGPGHSSSANLGSRRRKAEIPSARLRAVAIRTASTSVASGSRRS